MLEATVPALARNAAAIHGYCRVSRRLLVPATVTETIRAPAARQNLKRSIPAVIVTVMEAGSSIRPASTGAPVLAGIAVQRIMITLRTA